MGGLGPMSARKFSKLFHLSHTLIPRPPQSGHLGCLGLRHRCRDTQALQAKLDELLRGAHSGLFYVGFRTSQTGSAQGT